MKRILVIATCLVLLASPALATTTTVYATRAAVPDGSKANGHVLYEAKLAATLAQNDSCYVLIPWQGAYNPEGDATDAPTISFTYWIAGMDAAADSVSMVIGTSPNITGPWTSPFSTGLQALTLTGTTPWVNKYETAVTSLPPVQWLRFALKNKGAASQANKKFYVMFPRINN